MNRQYARLPLLLLVLAAVALSGCENPQKKKEEELAKNTFACQLNGERFVVRFVEGEARMLLPGAQAPMITEALLSGANPKHS